jgi:hypothetical protein
MADGCQRGAAQHHFLNNLFGMTDFCLSTVLMNGATQTLNLGGEISFELHQ